MKKVITIIVVLLIFFGVAFVIIQKDERAKVSSQRKISEKSLVVKKSQLKRIKLINSIEVDWATIPSLEVGNKKCKQCIKDLKKYIAYLDSIEGDKTSIRKSQEAQNTLLEYRNYSNKVDDFSRKIKSLLQVEKNAELEATTTYEKNKDLYKLTKSIYNQILKLNKLLLGKVKSFTLI